MRRLLCVFGSRAQADRLTLKYVYLCLCDRMCGEDGGLSWSCKPCDINVRGRQVAYSLHFERQLGRSVLSTHKRTYILKPVTSIWRS